jgi:hypothetical protein
MGFGKSRVIRSGQGTGLGLLTFGLLSATGCVDRRFIIESDVPNAQVIINDKAVGAAPAHSTFEYYGTYDITLVHPGYETRSERVRVSSPWYGYPPFDFLAEVVWPLHIQDTRRYFFHLQESPPTRTDELINNAEALRQRGYELPQPADPAPPKAAPNSPLPGPGVPSVLPPAIPPQPGATLPPGPGGPAGGPVPGGIVPSVAPAGP